MGRVPSRKFVTGECFTAGTPVHVPDDDTAAGSALFPAAWVGGPFGLALVGLALLSASDDSAPARHAGRCGASCHSVAPTFAASIQNATIPVVPDRAARCDLPMPPFQFTLDAVDRSTGARAGRWATPHGLVETPAFMPVGTLATVKGLLPEQLRAVGVQMLLGNTYHLALRPGAEVVADLGGLHRFMGWNGPILTDSGGFQIFSLAKLTKLDDQRAVFRSHIDGSLFELSPEDAMRIQGQLGADCIMCLDECPPHGVSPEAIEAAVDRTTRWAARCRDAHCRGDQALFGILQGGTDARLRERSARGLLPLDFPGYALGGLSVGEEPAAMYATLDVAAPLLPSDKPRYLMGVGRPIDLVEGVLRGIDLFDCVMPTRNGRNAMAFTSRGPVKLRNLKHQRDPAPLDPECDCPACAQFSRAYLRHLFIAGEMLGPILISLHNIAHYERLMRDLRAAIIAGTAAEFREKVRATTARDATAP